MPQPLEITEGIFVESYPAGKPDKRDSNYTPYAYLLIELLSVGPNNYNRVPFRAFFGSEEVKRKFNASGIKDLDFVRIEYMPGTEPNGFDLVIYDIEKMSALHLKHLLQVINKHKGHTLYSPSTHPARIPTEEEKKQTTAVKEAIKRMIENMGGEIYEMKKDNIISAMPASLGNAKNLINLTASALANNPAKLKPTRFYLALIQPQGYIWFKTRCALVLTYKLNGCRKGRKCCPKAAIYKSKKLAIAAWKRRHGDGYTARERSRYWEIMSFTKTGVFVDNEPLAPSELRKKLTIKEENIKGREFTYKEHTEFFPLKDWPKKSWKRKYPYCHQQA